MARDEYGIFDWLDKIGDRFNEFLDDRLGNTAVGRALETIGSPIANLFGGKPESFQVDTSNYDPSTAVAVAPDTVQRGGASAAIAVSAERYADLGSIMGRDDIAQETKMAFSGPVQRDGINLVVGDMGDTYERLADRGAPNTQPGLPARGAALQTGAALA